MLLSPVPSPMGTNSTKTAHPRAHSDSGIQAEVLVQILFPYMFYTFQLLPQLWAFFSQISS